MKPIKHVAALAAAALMAGCGGGGNTPATETASLTVQGDVIKGAMANATVSLYKPNAEGQKGDLLEKTTTDTNGHYSATVKGYSGVMIMEATVVPRTTTMYDEATNGDIFPPDKFAMRASFSAEAGKTNMAQINPFTELATAKAIKAGGLTAANVAQANKDLAESLTFDPLTSKPEFDATTKVPKNAAAVTLAAVSLMAESGELGCSGEQAAKVACVVQALSDKGLADTGVKASLQTFTNAVAFKAGLQSVTITDPSGTAPSTASAVEQAKAFITMLRSNAKALGVTKLSLQDEFQLVANDMTSHTAPRAKASIDALNLARLGVQFMNDQIEYPGTTPATRTLGSGESCTYASTPQKNVTCTNSATVVTTKLTQDTTTNPLIFTMSTSQYTPGTTTTTSSATLTTTRIGGNTGRVTSVKLVGNLPSIDAAFQYTVNLSAALLPTALDGRDELAVSGSIDLKTSATTPALIERIELLTGSYLKAKLATNSYSAQDGSQEMLLKLKASTPAMAAKPASAVTGDLKFSAFKLDASSTSYIPTLVSFAGSVQRDGVSFFDGTLTGEALNHAIFKSNEPRSTNNPQKMRLGFTGKVNIPTRPVLDVQLFVVTNDTGISATDTATLTGQFRQDAFVINLNGTTSATSNILTLESSEGIKLVIDPLAVTHPLTKNGEVLGNFSTTTSRVDYTDNSYEQF